MPRKEKRKQLCKLTCILWQRNSLFLRIGFFLAFISQSVCTDGWAKQNPAVAARAAVVALPERLVRLHESYAGTFLPICGAYSQGRNEVYGIRDQRPKKGWDQGSQPQIRDHSPRDRDQRVFHWLKDQHTLGSTKFCGIRDQNFHHFWDQGLKICVKTRDQRWKNIPRYDPVIRGVALFGVAIFRVKTVYQTIVNGEQIFLWLDTRNWCSWHKTTEVY